MHSFFLSLVQQIRHPIVIEVLTILQNTKLNNFLMRIFLLFIIVILAGNLHAQSRKTGNWFDFGSSHISKWIQVAPGKLGPNALPVPEMDYALVGTRSGLEIGAHANIMKGDSSVNSYMAFHWAVVPEKVAVKVWGIPSETFRTTNEVRDERQIYYDDMGWITNGGDLWISTYIQLLRNKRLLPELVLNYSMKTTTGAILQGRYTDAPAHYFYLAAGKSFFPEASFVNEIRLAGMGGIYIWQTNKVEMAQDEGPVFQAGIMLRHKRFLLYNEAGGYDGYGAYGFMDVADYNNPVVYRARLQRQGKHIDWKLEYKTGWIDYNYTTLKLELVYNFNL